MPDQPDTTPQTDDPNEAPAEAEDLDARVDALLARMQAAVAKIQSQLGNDSPDEAATDDGDLAQAIDALDAIDATPSDAAAGPEALVDRAQSLLDQVAQDADADADGDDRSPETPPADPDEAATLADLDADLADLAEAQGKAPPAPSRAAAADPPPKDTAAAGALDDELSGLADSLLDGLSDALERDLGASEPPPASRPAETASAKGPTPPTKDAPATRRAVEAPATPARAGDAPVTGPEGELSLAAQVQAFMDAMRYRPGPGEPPATSLDQLTHATRHIAANGVAPVARSAARHAARSARRAVPLLATGVVVMSKPLHGATPKTAGVLGVLAVWTTLMAVWIWSWVLFVRKPEPTLPLPPLSVRTLPPELEEPPIAAGGDSFSPRRED